MQYQWKSTSHDIFENRAHLETIDTQTKVEEKKEVTQWRTELITQPQTVLTTSRVYEDRGQSAFAEFAGTSIRGHPNTG